jgi:hypothetical protein
VNGGGGKSGESADVTIIVLYTEVQIAATLSSLLLFQEDTASYAKEN